MRFVITGEWSRNRLLQLIIVIFVIYVIGLWLTNALLYFQKMNLSYVSVTEYYLGSEERFLQPRSYQGMLEVTHFHLFAMGLLLLDADTSDAVRAHLSEPESLADYHSVFFRPGR